MSTITDSVPLTKLTRHWQWRPPQHLVRTRPPVYWGHYCITCCQACCTCVQLTGFNCWPHTHTQGQSVVLTSCLSWAPHTLIGQWQPESLVFRVGVCLLTSAHSSRLVAAQYGVLQVVDMAQNQGTPRSSYSNSPASSRANGANTSSIRSSVYFRGGISGCGQWCASKKCVYVVWNIYERRRKYFTYGRNKAELITRSYRSVRSYTPVATKQSCVKGYLVYKGVWAAIVGEELVCRRWRNSHDICCISRAIVSSLATFPGKYRTSNWTDCGHPFKWPF